MSSSPAPEDKSAQVAEIEARAAREAAEREAAAKAEQRTSFTNNLNSAYGGAVDEARNYFLSKGLDPDQYMSGISSAANSARTRVPDLSADPGSYFQNLGAGAYDTAETGQRNKFMRDVSSFAPSGFETRRIADTADDATLAAILAEQRSNADGYLRNLLDRGVINSAGYQGGVKDLDSQSAGANARLNEVGNTVINKGRTDATNIANQARQGASNYTLGETFDPFSYATDIDTTLSNFFQGLGSSIRGLVPQGLFSTSGLANIAGAAQGAQNTAFNPAALAGINSNEDDEDETALLSAF